MARSTNRIAVAGALDQPYGQAAELPWPDIEAATGVKFSDEDKREIFQCACLAFAHRSVAKDAASTKEVEALRKRIMSAAGELVAIAQQYRPVGKHAESDEAESVFLGVALSSPAPDFDLTKSLMQAASGCEEILRGLSASVIEGVETAQDPDVIALAYFIAEAVKGATTQPARTREAGMPPEKPTAFELHRWGLHLSPKGGDIPEFATKVLGRPVTHNQVQHAFKVARDFGLIERQE